MITTLSLTNGTLTVIVDNGANILPVRNDHPRWNELMELYKQCSFANGTVSGPTDKILELLSLKAVVEEYSVGQLTVSKMGVLFRGRALHSIDVDRVMSFLRDGLPFQPIANYIVRKMANPSARAITEMYNFLEHKNMPLTPDGKIIAYKGVGHDFYSVNGNKETVVIQGTVSSGGHLLNTVGSVIEVERSSVDDNYQHHCSFGLHAGSLTYAKGWGPRVVLVEIDPADVVSIPDDCSCQKLRCCKYKVIGEYTGPMPHTYTNEFSAPVDVDENGNCKYCGNPEEDCDCDADCGGCDRPESECECHLLNNDVTVPEPTSAPVAVPMPTVVPEAVMSAEWEIIAARVRDIIAEQLIVDPKRITNSTTLESLGMDSLDSVELTMAFEEEFHKEFADEEVEKYIGATFSEIVSAIYEQCPKAKVALPVVSDTPYHQGYQAGLQDRITFHLRRFHAGDQEGADSEAHAKYIDGYVNGYSY